MKTKTRGRVGVAFLRVFQDDDPGLLLPRLGLDPGLDLQKRVLPFGETVHAVDLELGAQDTEREGEKFCRERLVSGRAVGRLRLPAEAEVQVRPHRAHHQREHAEPRRRRGRRLPQGR